MVIFGSIIIGKIIGSAYGSRTPCTILERAYAFPSVRDAVDRLLTESAMARPRLTGSRYNRR